MARGDREVHGKTLRIYGASGVAGGVSWGARGDLVVLGEIPGGRGGFRGPGEDSWGDSGSFFYHINNLSWGTLMGYHT